MARRTRRATAVVRPTSISDDEITNTTSTYDNSDGQWNPTTTFSGSGQENAYSSDADYGGYLSDRWNQTGYSNSWSPTEGGTAVSETASVVVNTYGWGSMPSPSWSSPTTSTPSTALPGWENGAAPLGDPGCTTTTTGVGFLASLHSPSGDSVPTAAVPACRSGPGLPGTWHPSSAHPRCPMRSRPLPGQARRR